MVVDFSKIDLQEQPVLILKNTAGVPIGVLGSAMNVTTDIKYNESSVLEFSLPARTDDEDTPHYDSVVGMRVIELKDVGQFILMNPKESGDGIKQLKTCRAYSLEFEFTFKKITIENGTYNLWNPVAPDGTIIGMILELMPSWSVGEVDSSLIGKYRTFEVNNENIYNFIKSTVQQSYNCIFDFDTFNRKINVKDVSSHVVTNPVFISLNNLAKTIEVEEDTESIVTRLDVNGADGVTIRDVNPSGTNTIINLDFYMTPDNFDQSLIDKYYAWKDMYTGYQLPYYNLSIEYSLQMMRKVTAEAQLTDLQGELTSLENVQAATIQAIAQNLKTQSDLNTVNSNIRSKNAEISAKQTEINSISTYLESILADMKSINDKTNFQKYFTESEYILLDRYIKDDALSDSSFVFQETGTYEGSDSGSDIKNKSVSVSNATITHIDSSSGTDIYDIRGGSITVNGVVSCELVRGAFEYDADADEFLFTAYLCNGTMNGNAFPTACISIMGKSYSIAVSGSTLNYTASSGYLYATYDTSEYEKNSVAWDLFEYGAEILEKISQPSYVFGVTSANFLCLEDFVTFKNTLKHGEKVYVSIDENQTLSPIVIGAKIEWDNPQNLVLEFSDKYVSGDSAFRLADLLEQSVSMGKSVDLSKFTYSAFVDSGANTKVKEFMTSALDVAKNAIMSSKDQAISWGDSGIRLRKWTDASHTAYEPHQVWMNNNSILMTKNNWSTAEIAIGHFYDDNLGDCWGVVAPNIVGTLLAGNNLVIESEKKDGGTAVFKIDADGCVLYNSSFDIVSENNVTQIALDPQFGIVVGMYPVYKTTTARSTATKTVDTDRARFWVDTEGNLFFQGTLRATTGEFDGKVTAREGYIGNGSTGWTIGDTYIYNGKNSYASTTQGIYIGTDGISLGNASHYVKASKAGLLSANNVSLTGYIKATSGEIGGCSIVDGVLNIDAANIKTGVINVARIPNLSADKITSGTLDAGVVNVTNLNASNITVGTLNANRIPNLSADKITTGTLDASNVTIKNLSADTITVGKIQAGQIDGLPASQITSGTFAVTRIPNLSANKITSGTLDANDVTIANLTVDAAQITSGTISSARIGSLSADKISGGTLSGCSISIGSYFSVSTTGRVTLGYINSLYVYGDGGLWSGRHQGITDAIPYMNNTVDQFLLYTLHGVVIGYGNNN